MEGGSIDLRPRVGTVPEHVWPRSVQGLGEIGVSATAGEAGEKSLSVAPTMPQSPQHEPKL